MPFLLTFIYISYVLVMLELCIRLRTEAVLKSKNPMEQSWELRILKLTNQMAALYGGVERPNKKNIRSDELVNRSNK